MALGFKLFSQGYALVIGEPGEVNAHIAVFFFENDDIADDGASVLIVAAEINSSLISTVEFTLRIHLALENDENAKLCSFVNDVRPSKSERVPSSDIGFADGGRA